MILLLHLLHEICQRNSLSFCGMKENWKAITNTSQLWYPMDGFFSRAWLSSTQTNGESLNELDLHMILISFPALKASINCLKKSIEAVLMLCEGLNDVLTLQWFNADKEIESKRSTNTIWAPLFTTVILMRFLSRCLVVFVTCQIQSGLWMCIFMGERNRNCVRKQMNAHSSIHTNIQFGVWFELIQFNTVNVSVQELLEHFTAISNVTSRTLNKQLKECHVYSVITVCV